MLERQVLPRGMEQTPPQFERSVRTMSERLNLESMVERQVAAAEERTIYIEPTRDGIGRLCIEAPMVQLAAADNRVTDISKAPQVDGKLRMVTQLKVGVVTDILNDVDLINDDGQRGTTAGQGDGPVARFRGIRPRLLVTVPAMTLLKRGSAGGEPHEPGILEGYGPIDPQTVREIAGHATSMIRILTHSETGIVLSMGRKRYRIPSVLRTFFRIRDDTRRFPGCSRNVIHADLDHTREWASENGETAFNNLAFLSPGHHALKGNTAWKVEQDVDGPGNLTWTTPTGQTLPTEPEVRVGMAP